MQAAARQPSASDAVRGHVRVFEPDYHHDGLNPQPNRSGAVFMFLQGMRKGMVALQLKSIDESISTSISLGFEEKMSADVRAAVYRAALL